MSVPVQPTRLEPRHMHVFEDAQAVAEEAVRRILEAAHQGLERRGRFIIVLAGGSTPQLAYERLGYSYTDWSRWHVFFGDERCLPRGDPGRNDTMAERVWLSQVPIPSTQVHSIPAELGPEHGARAYQAVLDSVSLFDLVLLGIGEDGHTASLFPGHRHVTATKVVAVRNAPKPPPERVSLSVEALSASRQVLFLVTGASKQEAVKQWQDGASLPVAQIRPNGAVAVLLDRAAAGRAAR